jgi:hypothetical protein
MEKSIAAPYTMIRIQNIDDVLQIYDFVRLIE